MPLPSARRPGPFLLPSDTDFRFALLVASVLGVTLYVYNVLFFGLSGGGMDGLSVYGRCDVVAVGAAQRFATASSGRAPPGPFRAASVRALAFDRCIAPVRGATVVWMLGGVGAVGALAFARYWTWPAWKRRRHGLVPLSAEDAPEVLAELAALSAVAGLRRPPDFLWNPLRATASGVAFGRLNRPHVALGGGLVTRFYTDPAAFRAVVLHELAHLRNGDVDKTYLALSIWQAFVVAALVPYFLSLVGQPLDWAVAVTWRVALLAALVYLTRNALLRTRELYADARAKAWDGPDGALDRVLAGLSLPEAQDAGEAGRSRRWWARRPSWLSVHPDPRERRWALGDPGRLFRVGFRAAVATGIGATIAAPHAVDLLASAGLGGASDAVGPQLGAALLYAPLAAGVLALSAWQAALAPRRAGGAGTTAVGGVDRAGVAPLLLEQPGGEQPGGEGAAGAAGAERVAVAVGGGASGTLLRVGLGLAAGFLAGRLLSFAAVVAAPAPTGAAGALAGALLSLALVVGVLVGTLALMWWLGVCARAWAGDPMLRRAFALSLVVASGALALWLGVASATFEVRSLLAPRPPGGVAGAVWDALAEALSLLATLPLSGLVAAGLVAVPALAASRSRPSPSETAATGAPQAPVPDAAGAGALPGEGALGGGHGAPAAGVRGDGLP